jgi:AP2-associated kinase
MHDLKPPLLHRDLKVENILQASATSFKLCDFGSATPASLRPPSTTHEILALEADLNRHTTLQYRAPEMIDVYLRRPIDEKSGIDIDVSLVLLISNLVLFRCMGARRVII